MQVIEHVGRVRQEPNDVLLAEHDATRVPVTTVAEVLAVDDWARRRARELSA